MVMGCPPEGNENETAASGRQSGDFTANRPLALAGNLSEFGRPGCESVCAVRYLPLDAHGTAMGRRIVELCPRTAEFSSRPPAARQAADAGERRREPMALVTRCGFIMLQ